MKGRILGHLVILHAAAKFFTPPSADGVR
jgi:hypothetical protein